MEIDELLLYLRSSFINAAGDGGDMVWSVLSFVYIFKDFLGNTQSTDWGSFYCRAFRLDHWV